MTYNGLYLSLISIPKFVVRQTMLRDHLLTKIRQNSFFISLSSTSAMIRLRYNHCTCPNVCNVSCVLLNSYSGRGRYYVDITGRCTFLHKNILLCRNRGQGENNLPGHPNVAWTERDEHYNRSWYYFLGKTVNLYLMIIKENNIASTMDRQ